MQKTHFVVRVVKRGASTLQTYGLKVNGVPTSVSAEQVWWNDYIIKNNSYGYDSLRYIVDSIANAEMELYLSTNIYFVSLFPINIGGEIPNGGKWITYYPQVPAPISLDTSRVWSQWEVSNGLNWRYNTGTEYNEFRPEKWNYWFAFRGQAGLNIVPFMELELFRETVDGRIKKYHYKNCVQAEDYYLTGEKHIVLHGNSLLVRDRFRKFHDKMGKVFRFLSGASFDKDGILRDGPELVANLNINCVTFNRSHMRKYHAQVNRNSWRQRVADRVLADLQNFNSLSAPESYNVPPTMNNWLTVGDSQTFAAWRRNQFVLGTVGVANLMQTGEIAYSTKSAFLKDKLDAYDTELIDNFATVLWPTSAKSLAWSITRNINGMRFEGYRQYPAALTYAENIPANGLFGQQIIASGTTIEEAQRQVLLSEARAYGVYVDRWFGILADRMDACISALYWRESKTTSKRCSGKVVTKGYTRDTLASKLESGDFHVTLTGAQYANIEWGTNYLAGDADAKMNIPTLGTIEIYDDPVRPQMQFSCLAFWMNQVERYFSSIPVFDAFAYWTSVKAQYSPIPAPVIPAPVPVQPPKPRGIIWDNTIHPLDPEIEDAEAVAMLEQAEENARKTAHAMAKIIIAEEQVRGRFPRGPEGQALKALIHGTIDWVVNQINPNDDPGEYIIANSLTALPEPWGTLLKLILKASGIDPNKYTLSPPP